MKNRILLPTLVLNLLGLSVPAGWAADLGAPEDNGLTPGSPTIYVNQNGAAINNGQASGLGVAIANNGNVIIGFEDAVNVLTLLGLQRAGWTMYDSSGNSIIATQTITSIAQVGGNPIFTPASIDSQFLAFYRSDGTATPRAEAWAPKIKANLFGAGVGMGAAADYLLLEIPELVPIIMDDSPPDPLFGITGGDVPVVQLLNNDGSKAANVLSVSDADAQPAGVIRIADWDYLSDGNILIVGESRQNDELVNRFGGANPGQHVVFRIVRPDGTEVKGLTLGSENAVPNSMWHGAGVTKGRFALRFDEGGAKIRIFNNDGTPVTGNLNLGTLTGKPAFSQGGRGDEAGFHGNGVDAYVVVNSATDPADNIRKAWIAVINDNGTLRYARVVSDDVALAATDRVDGAIDGCGRAIAVYADAGGTTHSTPIVRGRLFNRNGSPLGGTFYVSENEKPDTVGVVRAQRPRAAWRGDKVAVVWETQNDPANLGVQTAAGRFFSVAPLGPPEDNGLTPVSGTFYVNTETTINNGRLESLGVAIANNGNVLIGWEDDGSGLTDLEAVWTLFDRAGNLLTMDQTITSLQPQFPDPIMSHFLSYFRSDGTPIAGRTSWGPKIKANPFGPGLGMGGTSFEIGLEIPELADINVDDGGGGDFPTVQLLNNDGTPSIMVPLSGYSDEDAQPTGDVRIGDWDYLSDGNIVIVGESRQGLDLVNRFGGVNPGNHATFRVVRPDGTEVKSLTLVSAEAVPNEIWHGVGVTRGGFAVRFNQGTAKVRLFRNDGTPLTGNIDLATLTGNPAVGQGGRGDGTGFHGNGNDAYLNVNTGTDPADGIPKAWVTVLNADGTLRYSRAASDDAPLSNSDRVDGAIDTCGRVIAVYADAAGTLNNVRVTRGRLFSPNGSPIGCTFYVSELETPTNAVFGTQHPRAAWRGDKVVVVWQSGNYPALANRVVAGRIFSVPSFGPPENNGLTPVSGTFYVNTNDMLNNVNNGRLESLGVAIANNGNVLIGWEDDGSGLTDLEAVWTLFDGAGNLLTMDQTITSLQPQFPDPIMSHFLSYFRSDGTPIAGRTSWGPKIKANPFGPGLGMGGTSFEIGLEIPELADINVDDGGGGDFPTVQLLNNDGTPAIMVPLSGYSDADAQPTGDVRIGDWDYLSDGNIVIVGESRQGLDLVNRFGGANPGNHATFRIVRRDGTEVKSLTLVSEEAVPNEIWHGVGVTASGFAVRFNQGTAKVRIFRNDGTPLTGNIDLATLTGNSAVGQGGRGDGTGFHGNGNDAYLNVNTGTDPADGIAKPWVTVLNGDGSLRYSRPVSDDAPTVNSDRVDGAIDSFGRVIVVYADAGGTSNNVRVVRGQIFNPNGGAATCTFHVSELETPASTMFGTQHPRAAWRGDKVAVVWQSGNYPALGSRVVAGRIFSVPGPVATILSIVRDGGDVVVTWGGGGTLQSAAEVTGPWNNVPNASSPYRTAAGGDRQFFRVR
jgi:hypothetical protein